MVSILALFLKSPNTILRVFKDLFFLLHFFMVYVLFHLYAPDGIYLVICYGRLTSFCLEV